jgi:phage-related protein
VSEREEPIHWIGSSLEDLRSFPEDVRRSMGYALHLAETGGKSPAAKPVEGFKGASVMKIVEDHDGDTYRAVYTVQFAEAIYVLHCFQKKSKSGAATPKQDLDLIKTRLKRAEKEHKEWLKKNRKK